jgi:hypothetical protein
MVENCWSEAGISNATRFWGEEGEGEGVRFRRVMMSGEEPQRPLSKRRRLYTRIRARGRLLKGRVDGGLKWGCAQSARALRGLLQCDMVLMVEYYIKID